MNLRMCYLTPKQSLIWSLNSNGLTESSIARKLFVTRQTVHHALNAANQKIGESLQETANINKIEIETVDLSKGFLIGYSLHFKSQAFITFSAKNGIQIWYKHEANCEKCKRLKKCKEVLLEEIRARKLTLPDQSSQMLPSKLAEILFSEITGGKKDGHT
jgi:predicted transcriptional regulator